ncbi:FG-GAP repeat protein [Poriferisphaera sp. WC338]|uniref:FG-GAP repeat protein n=1 Tax=Poriferisphaera sp. WC338 TaxID=3425129 RepID=UPI003D8195EE
MMLSATCGSQKTNRSITRICTTSLFALAALLSSVATTHAEIKITSNDAAAEDWFGFATDVYNDIAIVSAFRNDDNGTDSGSVYLFNTSNNKQVAKLTASDAAADDKFGVSVAINGNTAIIGAPSKDDLGLNSGAAYLFDIQTGTQITRLIPSGPQKGGYFGGAVAIHGNTAIVGASGNDELGINTGAAYLFDIATGNQIAKLTSSDIAVWDAFGHSVAIENDFAIVGTPSKDDEHGKNSGAAYIFDVKTGQQITKLTPNDPVEYNSFGNAVAISGNIAIVGANANDEYGINAGAVYLFDITTGNQITKLTASDTVAGDLFGYSIAISNDIALISALSHDADDPNTGAVYVFDITTGNQLAKLVATDPATFDGYGSDVGIHGNTIVIGAKYTDDHGYNSGSAYIYDLPTIIPEPASLSLITLASLFLTNHRPTRRKRA